MLENKYEGGVHLKLPMGEGPQVSALDQCFLFGSLEVAQNTNHGIV
jgi:hypothetical protein